LEIQLTKEISENTEQQFGIILAGRKRNLCWIAVSSELFKVEFALS